MNIEKIDLALGGVVAASLLLLFVTLGTLFSGWYTYEYRCTDEVAEKRLNIWWGVPFAGFEPIDGDPVGACDRLKGE